MNVTSAPDNVVSLNLPAGSVVAVGVGVTSAVTGAGGVVADGAAQDDNAKAAAAKVAMVRCFMMVPPVDLDGSMVSIARADLFIPGPL